MSTQTSPPLDSPMPVSFGASFHRFPNLPYEIRHAIWTLCKPHRVADMDRLAIAIEEDMIASCRGVGLTSFHNSLPPVITQVCRESRKVFMEHHGVLYGKARWKEESLASESEHFGYYADMNWFNPSTDIIHLNVCDLSGMMIC